MTLAAASGRPWIVLVGGFLGAGKTTLILAAARALESRGQRCAVILNDQGDQLVDTTLARARDLVAREVTGGCFCCRLSGLLETIEDICATHRVDVIFAEPVGSCTDISATVVAPLLEEWHRFRIAPLTVLVDPTRAAELLREDADPEMAYLFRKQLQEADLICWTKSDIPSDVPSIPGIGGRRLSAKTFDGVEQWLDEILLGSIAPGKTVLDIDYTRYAESEGALAWLNFDCTLRPVTPTSPASVVGPLLDAFDEGLTAVNIPIVHLKVFDHSPTGWLKAAICANTEQPTVEGILDASPTSQHDLLVNLRAKGDPVRVRSVVEQVLESYGPQVFSVRLNCFSPAPPKPERRIARP